MLRLGGRLVGSFYVAFFTFMLLAHVFGSEPVAEKPLTPVEIGIFVAIGVSSLGAVVCWWKAVPGACLMLIGWAALISLQWFLLLNPFFGLPAIAGILLIVAARRDRLSRARAARAPASPE